MEENLETEFAEYGIPIEHAEKTMHIELSPYENFFNMTTVLIIDSIEIKNSFINVFQMPESGLKAGNVSFNKVNGCLFKLDNQLKTFNVNANCQFMNNAPLGITLTCFQKDGINNIKRFISRKTNYANCSYSVCCC